LRLANKSAIVNHASTLSRATPAIILRARRPCGNQTKVIKAVGFLGVAVEAETQQEESLEYIHMI
jgi:hypothetical protein